MRFTVFNCLKEIIFYIVVFEFWAGKYRKCSFGGAMALVRDSYKCPTDGLVTPVHRLGDLREERSCKNYILSYVAVVAFSFFLVLCLSLFLLKEKVTKKL